MLHSMLLREGGEHFRDRRGEMLEESEREVAGVERLSEEKEDELGERNRDVEQYAEEEPNEKRRKMKEPELELVEESTQLERVDSLEVNEEAFPPLFPFFNALPKTVQEDVAKMLTNKDRRALSQTCVQIRGLLWDQNSKFLDCRIRSPLFAVFLADTVWLSKKGLIPQRENVFATDGEVMNQGFLDLVDIIRTTTEATPSVTVRVERLSPSQVAYLKHMMLNLENLVVSIRWEFLSGILDEMLIFLLNECTSEVHLTITKSIKVDRLEKIVKQKIVDMEIVEQPVVRRMPGAFDSTPFHHNGLHFKSVGKMRDICIQPW